MAERAFVRSWAALVDGADPAQVAAAECAAALAGARLAGVDAAVLREAGLTPDEAADVLARAVDEVAGGLHPATVDRARCARWCRSTAEARTGTARCRASWRRSAASRARARRRRAVRG